MQPWKDVQDTVSRSSCRLIWVAWKKAYTTYLYVYTHRYMWILLLILRKTRGNSSYTVTEVVSGEWD